MRSVSPVSLFEKATYIPPDAIFDVTRRYLADEDPNKVNLGQGTYRDENGKPWILPAVRMAKDKLGNDGYHEYLPIAGLKEFRDEAVNLVFHGTKSLEEKRVSNTRILAT
jgi:aspartate aminotransferase, cytoplasmic